MNTHRDRMSIRTTFDRGPAYTMTARVINETTDTLIRSALAEELGLQHASDNKVRIIHEFQVRHGAARVDIAVVNGVMHGYEIKSDRDTLLRLPEQIGAYNSVFDQLTIVVGKTHLYDAIHMVPEWWGIRIAKVMANDVVAFCEIRAARENPEKDSIAIAQLLWRHEALCILEDHGAAIGLRSKPRMEIYKKLASTLDQESLGAKVRETIFFRDWRLDAPLMLNGG